MVPCIRKGGRGRGDGLAGQEMQAGDKAVSKFRISVISWDKDLEWAFGGTRFGAQERDGLEIEILESLLIGSLWGHGLE